MKNTFFTSLFAAIIMLFLTAPVNTAFASGEDEDFDAMHHALDGVYMDFSPFGILELPRIFLTKDEQGSFSLDFYGSTAGVLADNAYIPMHEGADTHGGHGLSEADIKEAIAAHHHFDFVFTPAHGTLVVDFSITRHLVFSILMAMLVLALFLPLAGKYKKGIGRTSAPKGGLQNALESIVVFVRDDIAKQNIGPRHREFTPYLLTTFVFILFCNYIGLMPFGATPTSNISITAVLAVFTFLVTQKAGTKDYWTHIFWPPGIPIFVKPFLIPVEILGMFTKPFALAVRLFANMIAGHMVILSLLGLIFTIATLFGTGAGYGTTVISVPLTLFVFMLELLVAFIQAYVFTMLSAVFIGMAVEEHHHDEDHGHEHHEVVSA